MKRDFSDYKLNNSTMDKDNIKDSIEMEKTLQELLDELPSADNTLNTPTKEEAISKPWWLSEENLLGEVELDYTAEAIEKVEAKPVVKDLKEVIKEEEKQVINKTTTVKLDKSGRIAKKEITTAQVDGQDPVTGGATPLETVEGLPTGAGTGRVDNTQGQPKEITRIRTQQMGLCSVQMVRLAEEDERPTKEKPGQLSWVTVETERAIRKMIAGPDVTRQWCSECGFQGTRKRVRIHCAQHFCKHFCECTFMKVSRDAVYDHQISKHGSNDHGGLSRRIYCVDGPSYPDFCAAMGWEDPPVFGEPCPTRRGPPDFCNKPASSPPPHPVRKNIMTRLGKQHKQEATPTEEKTAMAPTLTPGYKIPLTAEALLRQIRTRRLTMGAELRDQMARIKEKLSQESTESTDIEYELHAELELLRQAVLRLCLE